MPDLSRPSSDLAAPAGPPALSAVEFARADRVARRLHGELAGLLRALPAAARNASGLARHLGIDRTTCQRAVFTASRPYDGPESLTRLPGVRGLRQLVEAAGAADPAPDPSVLDAVTTAVDQFQDLVAALGGSQSRLARRLARGAAPASASPAARSDDARVRLFEAAAELTGRSSSCWVAVYAYRPSASDPGLVEEFRANGLIGHVARPDAVPLVIHNFSTSGDERVAPRPGRFGSLEHAVVQGRDATVVLEEFTSDPPPLVTSRQPDQFLVQSIDERSPGAGGPVDLMLAARTTAPHPMRRDPAVDEVWALVNFPCRHLLFDVYLHRDLARACIPSLDAHLWGPDFAEHVGDRWQTRFADPPPLQLLGPGPARPSPPAYPRLSELTEHLFSRVSLAADEYVGFRCEVAYPLWRAGYCVTFDYARPEDGAEG